MNLAIDVILTGFRVQGWIPGQSCWNSVFFFGGVFCLDCLWK